MTFSASSYLPPCKAYMLGLAIAGLSANTAVQAAAPNATPAVIINNDIATIPASLHQVKESGQVVLRVKEGSLLQLPRAAAKVLIANPRIASFQIPSPNSVFVFAEAAGTTTLYAMDANDQVIAALRVVAELNLDVLREQITRTMPSARIELEPSLNNRIIVRGSVRTPLEAKQVVDQVQAYLDANTSTTGAGAAGAAGGAAQAGGAAAGGAAGAAAGRGNAAGGNNSGVINQLKVELSSQVNIQVRVVEVSRSLSHELGFNWSSVLTTSNSTLALGFGSNAPGLFNAINSTVSGLAPTVTDGATLSGSGGATLGGIRTRGRFQLGTFLTALSSNGLATLLAEPNLTAMSGESAAFAVGGEVPIVIITNNQVNINFKSYGVIMRMTPTLLSANRISLHIAPEVSELTDIGAVTLPGGSTVPAFKVRRADTTVELASGQSFALAGMLRNNTSQQVTGVPGLSNIPWLGKLFEHEETTSEETELVLLVTANVVDPVSPDKLQIPGRGIGPIDALAPKQAVTGYLY